MVHASLFSGIGGFDLAADVMGWKNAFNCEKDNWCAKVLQYHFPNSVHYDDITKTNFFEWRGKIDVLTGGFPCQPFSLAGQRKGINDDRYLWPEMLRAIREIKPAYVIGENVAGILSMVQPGSEIAMESQASLFEAADKETILEQEYVIETICSDLEREEYSVQPFLIPACSVAAPHRRNRIWFIANRNGIGREERGTDSERETNCKENGEYIFLKTFRLGKEWTSSYTNGKRCHDGYDNRKRRSVRDKPQGEITENKSEWAERELRFGSVCSNITDSTSTGFQREMPSNAELFTELFSNFPTQSPICRGNDGIPFDVDSLTISASNWRKESIRAYGNAIVPQVAFQIFKAIESVYDLKLD